MLLENERKQMVFWNMCCVCVCSLFFIPKYLQPWFLMTRNRLRLDFYASILYFARTKFHENKSHYFAIWKAVIVYLEGEKAQRVDRNRCCLFFVLTTTGTLLHCLIL